MTGDQDGDDDCSGHRNVVLRLADEEQERNQDLFSRSRGQDGQPERTSADLYCHARRHCGMSSHKRSLRDRGRKPTETERRSESSHRPRPKNLSGCHPRDVACLLAESMTELVGGEQHDNARHARINSAPCTLWLYNILLCCVNIVFVDYNYFKMTKTRCF